MADLLQLEGILVGCTERAYKPFAGRGGEMLPGGVTYKCFVVSDFAAEPVEVKVPAAVEFGALRTAGLGAKVSMTCVLFAKVVNGVAFIERSAVEGTVAVAATNGKRAATADAS